MSDPENNRTRPADAPQSLYGPDGRPQIFEDPAMDRFVAVLLNVTSELWVQTEKLATLETAILQKGLLTSDALQALSADPALSAKRDEAARAFIQSLLAPLREPAP